MANEAMKQGESCLLSAHQRTISSALILVGLLFLGCTGDDDERAVAELSIEPERVELTVGERAQFQAVGILADGEEIQISPERASVTAGKSIRLQATGFDAAGNEIEIEPQWSFVERDDDHEASLDDNGLFRAETARRFALQARVGDVEATATLEVGPGALATLEVLADGVTLTRNTLLRFHDDTD